MSMSRVVALLLAAIALAVAVMVGRWSARPAEPVAAPMPAPAVAAPNPSPARPVTASAPPADTGWSTAPWDRAAASSAGTGTANAAPAAPTGDTERMRALERIAQRLEAQRRSSRPDPVEIDKALAELERVNGGSQMAGIDLSAIRANLRAVARIQEISREMEQLRAASGELKDADRARLMEKSKELQAVMAEMRSGAAVSAPTASRGAAARGTTP